MFEVTICHHLPLQRSQYMLWACLVRLLSYAESHKARSRRLRAVIIAAKRIFKPPTKRGQHYGRISSRVAPYPGLCIKSHHAAFILEKLLPDLDSRVLTVLHRQKNAAACIRMSLSRNNIKVTTMVDQLQINAAWHFMSTGPCRHIPSTPDIG